MGLEKILTRLVTGILLVGAATLYAVQRKTYRQERLQSYIIGIADDPDPALPSNIAKPTIIEIQEETGKVKNLMEYCSHARFLAREKNPGAYHFPIMLNLIVANNGNEIFFIGSKEDAADSHEPAIYQLDPAKDRDECIIQRNVANLQVSPDGRMLSYLADEGQLFLFDREKKEEESLIPRITMIRDYCWSPTCSEIAVRYQEKDREQVAFLNILSRTLEELVIRNPERGEEKIDGNVTWMSYLQRSAALALVIEPLPDVLLLGGLPNNEGNNTTFFGIYERSSGNTQFWPLNNRVTKGTIAPDEKKFLYREQATIRQLDLEEGEANMVTPALPLTPSQGLMGWSWDGRRVGLQLFVEKPNGSVNLLAVVDPNRTRPKILYHGFQEGFFIRKK